MFSKVTQINDVMTETSASAFNNGQNPVPSTGKLFIILISFDRHFKDQILFIMNNHKSENFDRSIVEASSWKTLLLQYDIEAVSTHKYISY